MSKNKPRARGALTLVGVLVLVVVALLGVALTRAAMLSSVQVEVEPVTIEVDEKGAIERMAAALRFETIAHPDQVIAPEPFLAFHEFLEASYPRVHEALELRVVSGLTRHYIWPGSDSELGHIVFLAHQDVVPVEPGTEADWTHPPFSGAIADGFIWGRGAIDDKMAVMTLLEAVEGLLAQGHVPQRTIHLVFGHDEEVGGHNGARLVAQWLIDNGIQVDAIFDEGLVVTDGIVPGIEGRLALVGIAEKGYLTLEITARAEGGHSSMPPNELAVVSLARALTRLADHPMPASLEGPAALMFDHIGPEMDFGGRFIFANRWLFGPIVRGQMEAKPSTNALLRTTTAPTMLLGSPRENILPQQASARVNFRVHPRDSTDDVLTYVQSTVGANALEGSRLTVKAVGATRSEPSPVSSVETAEYRALTRALRETIPGVPVAPSMVLAMTDSRHFSDLTPNIYRFRPFTLGPDDLAMAHGTNERVRTTDVVNATAFYQRLISNLSP